MEPIPTARWQNGAAKITNSSSFPTELLNNFKFILDNAEWTQNWSEDKYPGGIIRMKLTVNMLRDNEFEIPRVCQEIRHRATLRV